MFIHCGEGAREFGEVSLLHRGSKKPDVRKNAGSCEWTRELLRTVEVRPSVGPVVDFCRAKPSLQFLVRRNRMSV
jgi:hypothetical protein